MEGVIRESGSPHGSGGIYCLQKDLGGMTDMQRIVVRGGRHLSGEVRIGGSKNAALPILFGGIATGGRCSFSNLPRVSDVLQTLEILKFLGARIRFMSTETLPSSETDITSVS